MNQEETTASSTDVLMKLRSFVEGYLRRAERVEESAIKGYSEREAARNNGKATAYEIVLAKINQLEGK